MDSENRLKPLGEKPIPTPPVLPETPWLEQASTEMLLLALKTLSQKAIVAIGQIFTLLTCFSAFWLWHNVLPNPDTYQLVGLGLYGGFILLLHLVIRKKG